MQPIVERLIFSWFFKATGFESQTPCLDYSRGRDYEPLCISAPLFIWSWSRNYFLRRCINKTTKLDVTYLRSVAVTSDALLNHIYVKFPMLVSCSHTSSVAILGRRRKSQPLFKVLFRLCSGWRIIRNQSQHLHKGLRDIWCKYTTEYKRLIGPAKNTCIIMIPV